MYLVIRNSTCTTIWVSKFNEAEMKVPCDIGNSDLIGEPKNNLDRYMQHYIVFAVAIGDALKRGKLRSLALWSRLGPEHLTI